MLGQFVLHVREQEEETADGIPQARMRQRLLIQCARALDDFSQRIEHLAGHADGFEEIRFARRVDDFLRAKSEGEGRTPHHLCIIRC